MPKGVFKHKPCSEETKRKIGQAIKGLKRSKKTIKKLSKSKLAEKNPNWIGDKVGYAGIHCWMRRRLKEPKKCPLCKKYAKSSRGLDLANISQEYKRDLTDWEWLCRRCHMTKDGRIKNLKQFSIDCGEELNRVKIKQ